MKDLHEIGQKAQKAGYLLGQLPTKEKNQTLLKIADVLEEHFPEILEANQADLLAGKENGMPVVKLDRLELTEARLIDMVQGIKQVAALPDPIGEVEKMWRNEDDLLIGRERVPLGVVGMIYESRPNVTTDAASLCFKSGNAVILRGGKEAIHSNVKLTELMQLGLQEAGQPVDAIQIIEDTSRETAQALMKLNDYLDVLIPRGGAGLIRSVVETATVPVIETGTGNCHIYVDKDAQLEMAKRIVVNAKTQRPSVCNAAEKLVIHSAVAKEYLPVIASALTDKGVELRGDKRACEILPDCQPINESEWGQEYLDLVIGIKVVDSLEEAIEHINRYNTKHSEAIVTDNYFAAQDFLKKIDAAAVYVNASTRFTDGFVFGFGAEIGISTQKLHARGPMGLEALTTTKYTIYGEGQIRK